MTSDADEVPGLVANLFRHSHARVVATLVARLGPERLDLVEDVTQEALLAALRTWPFRGVPADPVAWLFQAARNRALDRLRHETTARRLAARLAAEPAGSAEADVPDEVLVLLATCAALPLPRDTVVPLALSVVAGLSAREIARALLLEESTVAQRLVRAKRRLRAEPALVVLRRDDASLATALPAALDVVYLIFNEGFAPSRGDDPIRLDLIADAHRLAEALAAHPATAGPAPHALAALTAFLAARLPARAEGGGFALLPDQDRRRWDQRLIQRGFQHLQAAIGGGTLTRFHLEAEIAAIHAAAPAWEATDWDRIVAAYDKLLRVEASPVVALNRAVALAERDGAGAGLAALEPLFQRGDLERSPWYHATRARLLRRAGQLEPARAAWSRALELTEAGPARENLIRERDRPGPVSP
ncbi:MAG: sigma-70 family RNA polymerase sigma factor [Gemmatimonadota bacterium]|nr:sigma-70 family RNA polymerase sigma factor [Gemmatimonadota bacterium]